MRSNRGFKRSERVSRSIHRIVSEILAVETSDPGLKSVMVTRVQVTDDLKTAHIYWYLTSGDTAEAIATARKAFERSNKRLRHLMSERVAFKNTPALRFHYDESVDGVDRINQLLAQATADLSES